MSRMFLSSFIYQTQFRAHVSLNNRYIMTTVNFMISRNHIHGSMLLKNWNPSRAHRRGPILRSPVHGSDGATDGTSRISDGQWWPRNSRCASGQGSCGEVVYRDIVLTKFCHVRVKSAADSIVPRIDSKRASLTIHIDRSKTRHNISIR